MVKPNGQSPNSEWEVRTHYDYRFCSIHIQSSYGDAHSPVFQIALRELLKKMPRHEVLACLNMSEDPSLPPDTDIEKYRRVAIREVDMKGKVVLDIGGYDGWAAKLALDCGAARAICLDNHQYNHYGWEDKKLEGVEYVEGDFGDYYVWSEDTLKDEDSCLSVAVDGYKCVPRPDVLIFFNVLYHLKNPWAALDRLRELIKPDGVMLLCTLFRYHDGPWMYVYEPRECNPTDETVYFGPSLAALERLLKHTGWDFEQVGLAYDRVVYRCKPALGFERKHEET